MTVKVLEGAAFAHGIKKPETTAEHIIKHGEYPPAIKDAMLKEYLSRIGPAVGPDPAANR